MKIYLGSDHAGFELKEKLNIWLKEWGHDVKDLGPSKFVAGDDYPDYIKLVAQEISKDQNSFAGEAKAVILGHSGQGEAIVANRYKGVRAVVYYGEPIEIIKLSRQHNDANILSLGAHFLTDSEARDVTKIWLETKFSGEERHARRIAKID